MAQNIGHMPSQSLSKQVGLQPPKVTTTEYAGASCEIDTMNIPQATSNYNDDEEVEEEDADERKLSSIEKLCRLHRSCVPDNIVYLMMLLVFGVVFFMLCSRASDAKQPSFLFYAVYLLVTFCWFLVWLFARVVWSKVINNLPVLKRMTFYSSISSILDPEIFYLGAAISIYCFFNKALSLSANTTTLRTVPSVMSIKDIMETFDAQAATVTTTVDPKNLFFQFEKDVATLNLQLFSFAKFSMAATQGDLEVFTKTHVVLILWATRNLVVSVVMFFFLINFLMNVNPSLVKYLTMYSLLKSLNTSWAKLSLARMKLEREATVDNMSLTSSNRSASFLGDGEDLSTTQSRPAPSEKLQSKKSDDTSASGLVERKISMSSEVEELLSEEAKAKLQKKQFLSPSQDIRSTLSRLNTQQLFSSFKKQSRRVSSKQQAVQSKAPGQKTMTFLRPKEIRKTQRSAIHNLFAIEFVRINSPVVSVKGESQLDLLHGISGVEVELVSRRVAKLVGSRLFDELLEFRNRVAPTNENMTAQQMDCVVKQSLLQTLEDQAFVAHRSPVADLRMGTRDLRTKVSSIIHHKSSQANSPFSNLRKQSQSPSDRHPTIPAYRIKVKSPPKSEQSPRREEPDPKPAPQSETVQGSRSENTQKDLELSPPLYETEAKHMAAPTSSQGDHDESVIIFRREEAVAEKETSLDRLSRDIFEVFLGSDVDAFIKYLDLGGREDITKKQFVQLVVHIFDTRQQLISLVDGQAGIRAVFRRMVSILLTFLASLIFLVLIGVSVDTIVISGAAAISSITVSLSFLYSGFIQSVLFVCFLSPYDVGDRIRLDNDNLYEVSKISTYFTEMWDVHGKLTYFNHSILYNMLIKNESRCRHAGLEINFKVAFDTPPNKYEALHRAMEKYIHDTPEFIKDSFFCMMNEAVVGHYIRFTYWCTCIDSWGLWRSIWTTRGKFIQAIIRQCKALGIRYQLPVQPCLLKGPDYTAFAAMKTH